MKARSSWWPFSARDWQNFQVIPHALTLKYYSIKISAEQISLTKTSCSQVSASKIGFAEISLVEASASEVHVAQISLKKICAAEVRVAEISAAEISSAEIRLPEVGTAETFVASFGALEVFCTCHMQEDTRLLIAPALAVAR